MRLRVHALKAVLIMGLGIFENVAFQLINLVQALLKKCEKDVWRMVGGYVFNMRILQQLMK